MTVRIYKHGILLAALGLLAGMAPVCTLAQEAKPVTTDETIQFYQQAISGGDHSAEAYDRLGTGYIQKARETGDITYYELAEKSLQTALQLSPEGRDAALPFFHLGTVYYSEHRFAEAIPLAQKALAFDPRQDSAHLLIGDAEEEMGQYDEAKAEYARLSGGLRTLHRGLDYPLSVRRSTVAFLEGDSDEAIAKIKVAASMAAESGLPAENVAWTQCTLGELYFREGNLPHAEEAVQTALATYPHYHLALAWMARIRAAQKRYPEAMDYYRKAIAIIPMPTYAAALGDLYTKAGDRKSADQQYALVEYIGRLNALNRIAYNRELAVFYADHPRNLVDAVALANKELDVRQDIYTWDAIAWTDYRAGKKDEAEIAIRKALLLNTRDSMLWFHAGMIDLARNDQGRARAELEKALSYNPEFHVLYADEARRALAAMDKGYALNAGDGVHGR